MTVPSEEGTPMFSGYLKGRGIERVSNEYGVRVERIGDRASSYGFGPDQVEVARDCFALFIRYQTGLDRIRLLDPADVERFGGGKYRGAKGSSLALYDPRR